jgi:hypothetical protein
LGQFSVTDLRVHFGLGSVTKIDTDEIHWPSGQVDLLNNLAMDKFYSVVEKEGIVTP